MTLTIISLISAISLIFHLYVQQGGIEMTLLEIGIIVGVSLLLILVIKRSTLKGETNMLQILAEYDPEELAEIAKINPYFKKVLYNVQKAIAIVEEGDN